MMYKLLIVDDEMVERQAMRQMLMRGIEGAEIVGEAANGKEAIRLAEELQPDVVLMDIKMPGVNGVEAVKAIRKTHPDMKFIMVSAFDTFDYAREVMHEGVKEYLLKPGKKEEILTTVRRVIEEVRDEKTEEETRQALEGKLDQALSFVRSEWVTSLLLDHIQETEPSRWRELLDLDEGAVYAAVCRLSFSETHAPREKKKSAYACLKKAFGEQANCLVGPMSGGQVPILILAGVKRQTARAQAVAIVKEVLRTFDRKEKQTGIRIGIGGAVRDLDHFVSSYEEALIALEQTNEHVRSIVYHPSLTPSKEASVVKSEKQLLEAVKDGDTDGALSALEHYVHEPRANAKVMRKQLENLFLMISKIAEEMGMQLQIPDSFPEGAERRELRELAIVQLTRSVEAIREWQADRVRGILRDARQYIDEHFRESVTLETVAARVDLSPYYFSKLFKEQNGTTFIDYLTEVRVRRGKELLKKTRLSLKEICFEAGYRDPNYFSRVFKKSTGRSPSEYRASVTRPKTKG